MYKFYIYSTNKSKVLFLLLTIFIYSNISYIYANSNNIQFKNITIEDGLSQSTVEALYQDSNGYIWIGTNDGLDRYDGYNFKKYKQGDDVSTNIASNYILAIKEDKYKNIWVATINGLSKIDTKNNLVSNYYDSEEKGNLSNYNICDILITQDNNILVATGEGLNLYNEKNDNFERILENELTNQDIYSIDQDENGNIWLGTYEGLNKIDVKNKEIKQFYERDKNSISEDSIYKVYSDKNGYVWIGTFTSGINKIDINTDKVTIYKHVENDKSSLPGNFVSNMLRDDKNNMWIATDNGLAKYVKENENFITYDSDINNRHSLLNNSVFSIIQDKTGLIWVGTYEGISIFDPNNDIKHYKKNILKEESLSSDVIHGIYEDSNELLWIGTRANGLNIVNRKNNKIDYITKKDGLTSDTINFITGNDDYIWVATNEGLNRINKDNKKIKIYTEIEKISESQIKSLYLDSKNYLWIGAENGLSILNTETNEIKDMNYIFDKCNIKDKYVSSIYEDEYGDYWIGTFKDGKLIKIDKDNFKAKNYSEENYIKSNSIRCITGDYKGNLFIGTSYGLSKLNIKNGNIDKYTEKDGLSNNTIYGIVIDKDLNLWMSTNNGVSKLDTKKNRFTKYNITDGFQSNEFNGGAYFKNNKDEIFFGGINGLNIFKPSSMNSNNDIIPNIHFDKFIVNDKVYKDIDNKKFDYNGNSISIKFFLPDYKDSKNNKFFYKIKELDNEWNETTNNEIIYEKLNPGTYTFIIKATNNKGIESYESEVTFTIKPYILTSPIALMIYGLIIIILIYLNKTKMNKLDKLVDQRTNQLKEEMIKNKNLFEKIITIEQNKNNYFVNLSHELRTPLNVILTTQQLILQLNKKEKSIEKEKLNYHTKVMQNNTNRLLNLINNIIDTSKIEYGNYKIDIKKNDIVYIVEETCLSLKDYIEDKSISLIIDPEVEEKYIECDSLEIERCIVNLVSNAKKFTPEGGTIEVTLKDFNDYVEINVIDNGIGIPKKMQEDIFNRFSQVIDENLNHKGGSGLGLTITKHIVELHNGRIYVNSEENKGSKFTIILPSKIKES